jgi:hypothetical protein
LNNLGYTAELDGDWETAQSLYAAARSGRDANARVNYSTRRDAEGEKIDRLADNNQVDIEGTLKTMQDARRRANRPVELMRRAGISEVNEEEEKPVPPVGIEAPALPALPPPGSAQPPKQ